MALQTAGFPIYTERMDGKSLWSLLDTMKHHIPVPFTLPEFMALYFGSTMLKVFKGTAASILSTGDWPVSCNARQARIVCAT